MDHPAERIIGKALESIEKTNISLDLFSTIILGCGTSKLCSLSSAVLGTSTTSRDRFMANNSSTRCIDYK